MRNMEYSVCHERGTKKKSDSPIGIEAMTPPTPVGCSNHWVTGRLVASKVIFTEFVVTGVLPTAMISNVESTVCDNKERKMVNFKLGKKWERWNIQFVTSPQRESNPWSPRHRSGTLTTELLLISFRQGPKLRPAGRQCERKLSVGDQNFKASRLLATNFQRLVNVLNRRSRN